MHLMHWFELWVSQETAAHAAYMSWCLSPVRVSPREPARGVLCSGKCCHRGVGERWGAL